MALTLAKLSGSNTDDISGTYSLIKLSPDYEFEKSADGSSVTVRKAVYDNYNTLDIESLDFSDAQVFSCELEKLGEEKENYMPEGGLKLWKIQRKVYRLIGSTSRIAETTMYYEGEIEVSHTKKTDLPYTMKVSDDDGDWLHFEWLDAKGRMIEIMNQCDMNKINCTIRMRLKSGKCVCISTIPYKYN